MENKDFEVVTATLRELNFLDKYGVGFKSNGITDTEVSASLSTDASILKRVIPLVGHQVKFIKQFKHQKSLLQDSTSSPRASMPSTSRISLDQSISEPRETPEMYKKVEARLGYDLASPITLLRNAHEEAVKQFNAGAESYLEGVHYLPEEEFHNSLTKLGDRAMEFFHDRCSLIRVGRNEEGEQLGGSIKKRIAFYRDKNYAMRTFHEEALLKRAQDLTAEYYQVIKSRIGDMYVNEDEMTLCHEGVMNEMLQKYQNQFNTSPIFNVKVLKEMILSERYPTVVAEVENSNLEKKSLCMISNGLKRYEVVMRQVLAQEDFDETHRKVVSEIRQSFDSVDEKLYHFADMPKIIEEAKAEARAELHERLGITRQKIKAVLDEAKDVYDSAINQIMAKRIPVDEVILNHNHERNAEISLKLFNERFQGVSDIIKNSERVKQTVLEELRTAIELEQEQNRRINAERWEKYIQQVESAVEDCNRYFESEVAKVNRNHFDAATKLQRITETAERMFSEKADLRLFEPQCVQNAREKLRLSTYEPELANETSTSDEDLPDFIQSRQMFRAEDNFSALENVRTSNRPELTLISTSERVVTATLGAGGHTASNFLVKLNKGKLELQKDVFQKCQDYMKQQNILKLFFVSVVGQRKSGKTTVAYAVDNLLQGGDNLEDRGNLEPEDLTNGVVVFQHPGIRTYEDQPAAVFLLDIYAPQVSNEEYTALVDFCLMISSQVIFCVRPPGYEIHAWSCDRSITKYFGPIEKLHLHVLLQLGSEEYDHLRFVELEEKLHDHVEPSSLNLSEISPLPKDLRGSSFCIIPAKPTFDLLQAYVAETFSESKLSACFSSRHVVNCEAHVQEKIQQVNFLSGLTTKV